MNADEKIWRYLKSAGLNDFGVAGLMGNLFAESGLNPKNLQNTYEKKLGMTDEEYTAAVDSGSYSNFVKDSAGYGLAQWTYWSRKDALLASCKAAGASVGDMDAQLNFLLKELSVGYSGLLSTLKSAPSVREASKLFFSNLNVLPIRDRASKKNEPATDKLIMTSSLAKSKSIHQNRKEDAS